MPKVLLATLIFAMYSSLPHYAYATKAMDAFNKKDYNKPTGFGLVSPKKQNRNMDSVGFY